VTDPEPVAEDGGIEDIVVTAQRREERAIRVPVSITTLTSSALEAQGVSSLANLSVAVPGLQINRSLNAATPFLRGVGNPSGAAGEEGATAIYIDGVYNSNQYANMFELGSIERIEVLKGPQGTLFGRNAAAGAILITTRDPSHDFVLNANLGYANFDTYSGGVYASGGLSDGLSANILIQGRQQNDGWGTNLTTGNDTGLSNYWTVRGKLMAEIGNRTTATISLDYYRQKEQVVFRQLVRNAFGIDTPGFWNSSSDFGDRSDMSTYGGSLRVVHEADPFEIVSLTSYRKTGSDGFFDFDASPLGLIRFDPISARDKTALQELQIQSPAGSSIKWVTGVFLYNNVAEYKPFIQFGTGSPATANIFVNRQPRQTTNSYAGFAQATVPILTATNLTLGGRYSVDDRKLVYTQTSNLPALNVTNPLPVSVSYPKATWRVSLDHQFARDVMAYVSFNTGFKAGLFNLNTPTDPPVRPQSIEAWEVGFKGRMLDGKLQIEAAAFHTSFDDIQVRTVLTGGGTRLLNAAEARIKGFELNIQAAPVEGLNLNAGLSVLDAKYTSFPNAPGTVPRPATALPGGICPAAPSGPPTGGNISCTLDASGNSMVQAPKFSANLGATYTAQLAGGSSLVFNAAYSHTGEFFWEADNRLTEPAHDVVNGSISWNADEDRWGVTIWARNLTNARRNSLGLTNGFYDGGYPAEPRVYGVTLRTQLGN
jgi:iron complex outermembrane receptor protein